MKEDEGSIGVCVNTNLHRYLFAGGNVDLYTSTYYEHNDFYIPEMKIFITPSKQIFVYGIF